MLTSFLDLSNIVDKLLDISKAVREENAKVELLEGETSVRNIIDFTKDDIIFYRVTLCEAEGKLIKINRTISKGNLDSLKQAFPGMDTSMIENRVRKIAPLLRSQWGLVKLDNNEFIEEKKVQGMIELIDDKVIAYQIVAAINKANNGLVISRVLMKKDFTDFIKSIA